MYLKIAAILINSVFGICLTYTYIGIYFALTSNFAAELRFAAEYSMYNIVWLLSDIVYNRRRYQKRGGGLFFWLSVILFPVLILVILLGLIKMFFSIKLTWSFLSLTGDKQVNRGNLEESR